MKPMRNSNNAPKQNHLADWMLGSRDPFSKIKGNAKPWLSLIPLALVALVMVSEFLTPNVRITPSLLTITLAGLTLFLKPRAILIWAVILFFPVLLSLLVSFSDGTTEKPVVIFLRCTAFVVVSAMAYGLARTRENARSQVSDLVSLLDALHSPVVVSDVDGRILYANAAMHETLGRDLEMVPDANFLELFGPRGEDPAFLQEYLERCDGRNTTEPLRLAVRDRQQVRNFDADCSVLTIDGAPYLVSQIKPV